MKKIISVILIFVICFCNLSLVAFAGDVTSQYTDEEKNLIYQKYIANKHMFNALFNDDTTVGYWRMVNNTEENGVVSWSIDAASKIVGEYPNKQKYAEILANLIMMQSGDLAEHIATQSEFDDLKDGIDYAMDIIDIAAEFVGGAHLLETISPIIDAATGGKEVIIDNIEQAKYYQTTIQDYSQSKLLLEAVNKYAKNDELKSVSASLLKANDTLLEKRLEYLSDTTASIANYDAKFFVENLSFDLLKTADFYQSDETVKWFVDCGSDLADSLLSIWPAGQFAFHMTMLAGNIGFGTANTFNRYQEMKVLTDIANAIVEANHNVSTPPSYDSPDALTTIQTKCNYYKLLITIHARGEYLVYQLLVNDAGLLSEFRVLFDAFKEPNETTESWYNGQIDVMLKYYDILNDIFIINKTYPTISDTAKAPTDAVEFNGHYYYVYNLDTVTTWEEAKEYCESQGGYLATVTSKEEDEFLYSYITDMGFEYGLFGLSNTDQDDAWTWVTGEPFSYENWASGEPAQQLAPGTERYALYDTKSNSGHWCALDEETSAIVSVFVKNVSSVLNLRELPRHDSNLNGTVSDDTPLKYYGETGQGLGSDGIMHDWYKVYVDENLQGWVRSDLVQVVDNPATSKVNAFICEWDMENETPQEPMRTTSDERDIVLVLDTSGSMSGTPMEETKKAATKFVNTILEEDASIGIVTYEDSANRLSDFSIDKEYLTGKVANISDGGGTNIESGLAEAKSMLDSSNAKKKIIVLMSDGEPNEGKEGENLIAYADDIKSEDILIYTLGFFENMSGSKSSAQYLMEQLASDGCHYEVASADDLVFFFEDMADQINGQKYIYVRIACPVDVSVTYNGETLSSAENALNVRTDFGTLTFEDNENATSDDEDDRIKVLRLKEGADYDVQIVGTGRGMMDYTIGFMDENGDYNDFRRFENVKITKQTMIDTVAAVSDESVLNIDENGDGKYDVKLRAEENGYGEEVKTPVWIYVGIAGGAVLLVIIVLAMVKVRKSKKKGTVKS